MGKDFQDLFGPGEPGDETWPTGGDISEIEPENRKPHALHEKEVKVIGVFEPTSDEPTESTTPPPTFVLLQDRRQRKVPIWIGRTEAMAISMAMDGEEPERPMTHDLIRILLNKLGAGVDRVIIDDLWQETFYAKLTITHGSEVFDIDCRPSDAVAVALRTGAPIYIAEAVFEQVEQRF